MQEQSKKSWVVPVAVIVVAVLLFAGGYALGKLHGQESQAPAPSSSSVSSIQPSSATQAPPEQASSDTQATQVQGITAQASSDEEEASQTEPAASSATSPDYSTSTGQSPGSEVIDEDGTYTSKDEVALYIHTYGHLPSNFIGKNKAKKAGWVASKGNLDEVLPGMSIGGSVFHNNEGQLPDAPGRTWTECDINYEGGRRGAERIVFSNDGLIFYTSDHYKTFEQLY